MRAVEWRSHEPSELQFQLKELRKKLFDLRFKGASEEIQDSKSVQKVRRDIARIVTIQRQRELESNPRVSRTARGKKRHGQS